MSVDSKSEEWNAYTPQRWGSFVVFQEKLAKELLQ